jgi:hypothetical protein
MENKLSLTKLGTYAGSITAILALLWFIGEPALELYVDRHISTYEERKAEEDSKSVSLRHLLGDKMEVADDEVHIEIGRMYLNEKKLKNKVDSLEREIELNLESIQLNYRDIKKLQEGERNLRNELGHHGIFR